MKHELLAIVDLVGAGQPHVASLPQVVAHKIDSFILGAATHWSLESASERGLLRLLDRLLHYEWPGFSQICREMRLDRAVKSGYSGPIVKWWLECYMPGQTMVSWNQVCRLAIKSKHLQLVQWLLEERQEQIAPESFQACRSPEIAHWLYQHDRRLPVVVHVAADAGIDHIRWCLAVEKDQECSFSVVWPGIMSAIPFGHLELIQRLHENQPKRNALELALCHGRLDVAKWLHGTFQNLGFPRLCCTGYSNTSDHLCGNCVWKCVDLEFARWVFCELDWRDGKARSLCAKRMARIAASKGDLNVLEYPFEVLKMPLRGKTVLSEDMMPPACFDDTASNGHLSVIHWLHDHCQPGTSKAMDRAAENAHLDVVQWLHEHRTEGCTTDAMNNAARRGHLKVVQWLHENRTEGCTTQAMDLSAMTCQLETLQWLHKNRSEGWSRYVMDRAVIYRYLPVVRWMHENGAQEWTKRAMDGAAQMGYLDVVQWLHDNRNEGCTPRAMNDAASEGHLEIVQWLHENRTEGCTTSAMNSAAANGHLDVVRFLHENREEGCSDYAQIAALSNGDVDMFKWLHDYRPERCPQTVFLGQSFRVPGSLVILEFAVHHSEYVPLVFAVDVLLGRGRFGAVESILRKAHASGRSFVGSEFVETW